jgi:hypothetical protein
VESDYQQEPMDDLDYHGQTHKPHFGQQHKRSKKKVWIIIGIIFGTLLLLGGGGTAAYVLTHKKSSTAKPAQTTTANNSTATQPPVPGVQANGANNTFKSTTLNIGVTYPKTWSMRESSDKQEVIVTSPQTAYVKKDGSTVHGVFTVKLRNGIIPAAMKTTVQSAVAAADSLVIAYGQPTGTQRQYTNLSYAGADANNFNFAIITGYTSYKSGQAFGGGVALDGQAYMFAGGYGADAGDTLTFDAVPKTDYDTAVFEQAVAIFESLQLY